MNKIGKTEIVDEYHKKQFTDKKAMNIIRKIGFEIGISNNRKDFVRRNVRRNTKIR